MIRYIDKNGKSTGWLSKNPTTKELERLNIDQLLIIAKKKRIKESVVGFFEWSRTENLIILLICCYGIVLMCHNVPSIADGGALYHRCLIEIQNLIICRQIH